MDLQRFAGIARCYGTDGYARLAQARVCVVGIGGVGSWVAEALARSGVGYLRLIDLDDLCVSNTNRQLPALAGNFGDNKAEAMAARIRLINPACQVEAVADFVTAANVQASLADVDAVIDACDTLMAKQAIVVAAKRLKLPCFVSGAAGGQIDPGQIASADLSKVIQDPLLAKLRRELRAAGWPKDGKKMAVPCVYSTEQPRYPSADGGTQAKRSADAVGGLDCGGGLGASMPVTATFAMHLVALCLARLTR
ncbi:tRNA threonylcarbamoyladenosine dehydratase [Litorivicinus lipolyticus]|uniref:tRNA threonylcarbamoyladenosine dehydratase n=1 Tax=Litorivicinus lipolyticus TaxID=418701 RepID=UPI003B5A97C7